MDQLGMLYFEKELKDIKAFCIKEGLTTLYRGQMFYLYDKKIYNENMDVIVGYTENGFADLLGAEIE